MIVTFKRPLLSILAFLFFTCLVGCAGNKKQESTGEYIDNSVITTKVKTLLLKDVDVSGLAIEVESFKGTVQLSGFADSQLQRQKAENIAKGVSGVDEVKNNIIVK